MMKGQIIDGVPHVLVKLPWLIETMHKAFGDAKIERLQQPPSEAELMDADLQSIRTGATLLVEAWRPDGDERIGEEEYSNRWMR